MNGRLHALYSACSFATLIGIACGGGVGGTGDGDGGLSNSGGSALTSAGTSSAGVGGAGASAGGSLTAGFAGEAMAGTGGMSEAAGSGGSAGGSGGEASDNPLAVPNGCPVIQPEAVSGQTWALVVVNVVDDELIFQNVTNRPQEMSTDYQWCSVPIYERLIDLDASGNRQTVMVPPGGILRVPTLIPQGGLNLERDGGEMALYPAPGTYRNPEDIQLFVSWEGGNPTDGRESVAVAAGIWAFGDRIEIRSLDAGFVATGRTDSSDGFTSVPRGCMP